MPSVLLLLLYTDLVVHVGLLVPSLLSPRIPAQFEEKYIVFWLARLCSKKEFFEVSPSLRGNANGGGMQHLQQQQQLDWGGTNFCIGLGRREKRNGLDWKVRSRFNRIGQAWLIAPEFQGRSYLESCQSSSYVRFLGSGHERRRLFFASSSE